MCVDAKRFCNERRMRSTHGNATGHKALMHEQFQNFTLVYAGVAYDLCSFARNITVDIKIHYHRATELRTRAGVCYVFIQIAKA